MRGENLEDFSEGLFAVLMDKTEGGLHRKVVSQGATLQQESPGQPEVSLMDIDYADDMALLDNTDDGLQETTDLLGNYGVYAGLHINVKKTKSMATGKNTSQRPYTEDTTLDITVRDTPIGQVSHFV